MENHIIPVDSIFRNTNDFVKPNPFIYYLPDNLKNISYARLSSIELPPILPKFSDDLKNNTIEIARDLTTDSFNYLISENVTLTEGFYKNESLFNQTTNEMQFITTPTLVTNFKIELTTENGYLQVKISANENFSLNFGTENHPYSYLERDVVKTGVSVKDSKNYNLSKNLYYDSSTKEIYKYKVNRISTLNTLEESFLSDKLNVPILTNNNKDLNGNKKNFNIKIPPLGYYLGFRNKFYSGTNVYYSEASPNLNIFRYILVKVNNYGKTPTNHGDYEYLAKVVIKDQEETTYDNESNMLTKRFVFTKPEDISELNVSLHDPYGNVLDLNNQDYSLTLELGVINNSDLRNQYREGFP